MMLVKYIALLLFASLATTAVPLPYPVGSLTDDKRANGEGNNQPTPIVVAPKAAASDSANEIQDVVGAAMDKVADAILKRRGPTAIEKVTPGKGSEANLQARQLSRGNSAAAAQSSENTATGKGDKSGNGGDNASVGDKLHDLGAEFEAAGDGGGGGGGGGDGDKGGGDDSGDV
jgi:hypothetical protein